MKLDVFKEIVAQLKLMDEKENKLYESGLDIYNFNDNYQFVITHLIGSIYGHSGLETFQWWCYDKNWGAREDITMKSQDGAELCRTVEELHEYLEKNKKDDYDILVPIHQKEFDKIHNAFINEKNKKIIY